MAAAIAIAGCNSSALPPGGSDGGGYDLAGSGDAIAGDGAREAFAPDGGQAGGDGFGVPDGCVATFGGPLAFSAMPAMPADHPGKTVATDLNGDGLADVAFVGGAQWDSLLVLPGRGDGTLGPAGRYPVPARGYDGGRRFPAPLLAADLDGDGLADLVSASALGDVSVLLATRNGAFRAAVSNGPIPRDDFPSPLPLWLAAADMNGDRKLDLLVAGNASHALLGDGRGGLVPIPSLVDLPALSYHDVSWDSVALGDFDGDKIPDLAACEGASEFWIGRGLGNGYFTRSSSGGRCDAVAIADLDADGNLDVATRNSAWGYIGVRLGNHDGTFRDERVACPPNFRPESHYLVTATGGLPLVDVDRDGALDIVVANDQGLMICRGAGDGTFRNPNVFPLPGKSQEDSILAVADMNGDCRPDVVVVNPTDGTLQILLNTTP